MKPRILFYDIETTPLKAYIWGLGQPIINHGQLVKKNGIPSMYKIICISYAWNDDRPAKCIHWGIHRNTGRVIKEFDKIIKLADIAIGKNSDNFDIKHINIQRMLHKHTGMPDWAIYTEDLEKQLRKYFYLPSYSLDYISNLLGRGGKIKMELQDWINLVEKNDMKTLKKMIKYNLKDVEDTRALWYRLLPHIIPKFNQATFYQDIRCRTCGSKKIKMNGTRVRGKTRYQTFFCNEHGGYAGEAPINKKGDIGKIG